MACLFRETEGLRENVDWYENFISKMKISSYCYKTVNKSDRTITDAHKKWNCIHPDLYLDLYEYHTYLTNIYMVTNNANL